MFQYHSPIQEIQKQSFADVLQNMFLKISQILQGNISVRVSF